jgi:hypothetical protein
VVAIAWAGSVRAFVPGTRDSDSDRDSMVSTIIAHTPPTLVPPTGATITHSMF